MSFKSNTLYGLFSRMKDVDNSSVLFFDRRARQENEDINFQGVPPLAKKIKNDPVNEDPASRCLHSS